jgi:predicted DNA-binding transcriptional regulator AlpA
MSTTETRRAARAEHTLKAIKGFDALPDSAGVRLPVVCAVLGCSPATVWRHVRIGLLPAPRKVSPKVTTWPVGALRAILKGAEPPVAPDSAQHARATLAATRASAAA